MGTDRVKLLDKTLADRILAMDQDGFVQFLNENSKILSGRTVRG
jgi:hypothetical protein